MIGPITFLKNLLYFPIISIKVLNRFEFKQNLRILLLKHNRTTVKYPVYRVAHRRRDNEESILRE